MQQNKETIAIAEDNELYRTSLEIALTQYFELLWSAQDGLEAIEKFSRNASKIMIIDIEMPNLNGLEMIEKIKELKSDTKIIILTGYTEKAFVIEALKSNVHAYCSKSISLENLVNVINMVAGGALWFDPEISHYIYELINNSQEESTINYNLSSRELEVLKLITKGLGNKQIAHKLFISTHTVKAHIAKILEKLEVQDRTEAAVKAIKYKLI